MSPLMVCGLKLYGKIRFVVLEEGGSQRLEAKLFMELMEPANSRAILVRRDYDTATMHHIKVIHTVVNDDTYVKYIPQQLLHHHHSVIVPAGNVGIFLFCAIHLKHEDVLPHSFKCQGGLTTRPVEHSLVCFAALSHLVRPPGYWLGLEQAPVDCSVTAPRLNSRGRRDDSYQVMGAVAALAQW